MVSMILSEQHIWGENKGCNTRISSVVIWEGRSSCYSKGVPVLSSWFSGVSSG